MGDAPYMPVEAQRNDWGTPPKVFDPLNEEFGFTLDAAASDENALCDAYYTKEDNGLIQDWKGFSVWVNPPYDWKSLQAFTQKAMREVGNGVTTVMLMPSKTDQPWFHWLWERFVEGVWRVEFRWVKGRVKFVGAKDTAPFPVFVVVVGPGGR